MQEGLKVHVTYQRVQRVKGRAQKVEREEGNYLKKVFAKGGGEDMGRVCVAEHQKVVGFNNGFLIFSI